MLPASATMGQPAAAEEAELAVRAALAQQVKLCVHLAGGCQGVAGLDGRSQACQQRPWQEAVAPIQ